jgi:hypothetical protein
MSISAKQIKILLETNIPGINSQLVLDRTMIYHPTIKSTAKFSKYPFTTEDSKIPKSFLQRLSYKERVKFFFRKEIFMQTMQEHSFAMEGDDEDILLYNLATTMEILFPTIFPYINDHRISYDRYVLNESNASFTLKGSVPNMLQWMFPSLKADYSYLKVNGKVYTVGYTMVLNDIFNHPKYKRLLEEYETFSKWRSSKSSEITKILDQKKESLYEVTSERGKEVFESLKKKVNESHKTYNSEYNKSRYAERILTLDNMAHEITEIVKAIDNFNNLKGEMDKSKHSETMNKVKDALLKHISIFSELFYKEKRLFSLETRYMSVLDEIIALNEEISILNIIKNDYFGMVINGNFDVGPSGEGSSNKVKSYVAKNYPQYSEFIKVIQSYNGTRSESSNKALQNILKAISSKKGSKELSEFFESLNVRNFTDDNIRKAANTGVEKVNDTKEKTYYEGSVFIYVIGGELNHDNKRKINCKYYDYDLGRAWEMKKTNKRYELDKERHHFYSLDKLFQGEDVDKTDEDALNLKQDVTQKEGKRRGGKHRSRRAKVFNNKNTRKRVR